MQYLNKHLKGRQEVGHIDLLNKFCYIEVPNKDARRVMNAIDGTEYKGRSVRCNEAERDTSKQRNDKKKEQGKSFDKFEKKSKRRNDNRVRERNNQQVDSFLHDNERENDWRQFFKNNTPTLKGEEPDFSEEGWARRKKKK